MLTDWDNGFDLLLTLSPYISCFLVYFDLVLLFQMLLFPSLISFSEFSLCFVSLFLA